MAPGYWDDGGTPGDPDDDVWVDGDYRLSAGSPCIDAGGNAAVPADELDLDGDGDFDEPLPFDLDGHPRFVDDPNTPDTGAGEPPIVDMGAYEFQVLPPLCAGDMNCDGVADYDDIAPFVAALGCPGGEPGCWPPAGVPSDCPWLTADCNADGGVTYDDIGRFVARIGATCP